MNIGVLALQGAFVEHRYKLEALNVNSIELRQKSDLSKQLDGLILPGGESTAIGKLLVDLDMFNSIKDLIQNTMPVFGTCAGMILLAKNIANSSVKHLATMDISVIRNAYGRQLGSFNAISKFGDFDQVPMTFIRAPYIESVASNVKILSVVEGNIVAARQNNQLVTSFHPELTDNIAVHNYFLNMIEDTQQVTVERGIPK